MEVTVSNLLTKLEAQKADWLEHLDSWPLERLNHRPTAADWSALEVLDHIVKTEVGILAIARAGVSKPHQIGITDKVRTAFVFKIFLTDRKVKVPASASQVLPGADLNLALICQRWTISRTELSAFADGISSELASQGIFRHPVCGWMGLEQILEFFSVHLVHHRHQLNRIARSIAFEQT